MTSEPVVIDNDVPMPCVVCGEARNIPVTAIVAGRVDGQNGVVCICCAKSLRSWLSRCAAMIEEHYGRSPEDGWPETPRGQLAALDPRFPRAAPPVKGGSDRG